MQSLFIRSTFCYILITCFSLFCFDCVIFSKIESFVLGSCFDFFCVLFEFNKFESGFQKINLFSFNLGLMRFGYRGFLSWSCY